MLIGVNKPKKTMPNITGVTILPNKIPNFAHNLFKVRRRSGFRRVTTRNAAAMTNTVQAIIRLLARKKTPAIKKTVVQKAPNFRLEGRVIAENFISYPCALQPKFRNIFHAKWNRS
tara:strand:- start:875 stop:1222 length:348 start_codon:yes stop_codon:yes gene_type:complete